MIETYEGFIVQKINDDASIVEHVELFTSECVEKGYPFKGMHDLTEAKDFLNYVCSLSDKGRAAYIEGLCGILNGLQETEKLYWSPDAQCFIKVPSDLVADTSEEWRIRMENK